MIKDDDSKSQNKHLEVAQFLLLYDYAYSCITDFDSDSYRYRLTSTNLGYYRLPSLRTLASPTLALT